MRLGVQLHNTVPQKYLNLLQTQQHFNIVSMLEIFIPVVATMIFPKPKHHAARYRAKPVSQWGKELHGDVSKDTDNSWQLRETQTFYTDDFQKGT